MGGEVETGVNSNGVEWIKQGNVYYCSYYFGDGVTIEKAFTDVTQSFIDSLTFEELK